MVVGQTVHGAPGWQHGATHVVPLVALQRVFCGRRTRRAALVIDRGSFIYICGGERQWTGRWIRNSSVSRCMQYKGEEQTSNQLSGIITINQQRRKTQESGKSIFGIKFEINGGGGFMSPFEGDLGFISFFRLFFYRYILMASLGWGTRIFLARGERQGSRTKGAPHKTHPKLVIPNERIYLFQFRNSQIMVLEVVASLRHHMHRVVCRQFKLYIICHLLYRHYTDIECNYPWEEKSSRAGLNCLLCKAALCRHSTVDNCISMIILQETLLALCPMIHKVISMQ